MEVAMDSMIVAAAAMQNDQLRLESIAQNIANVLTPGYKKHTVTTSAFEVQMNAALAGRDARLTAVPGAPARVAIDPAAGALRPTGSPQDVAIEGQSFFEVNTPSGPAYTRQGALKTDVQGRLVGAHGMPMMGEGGEISLTGEGFRIAANGDVVQGERVMGRLKRVLFEHAERLLPQGDGLYLQGAAVVTDQRGSDPLRPGFQESSNVSSPQEMVRLNETVRHFEALQRIVQGQDESLENAIRKLGDF
jgi:flagellar basal body rod protein FlgG